MRGRRARPRPIACIRRRPCRESLSRFDAAPCRAGPCRSRSRRWSCLGQGLARAGDAIATSARTTAPVVELYTSEGCNSCPPADRWLSTLKADPAVVALAFHVDYWDRLGWKDRFASAAFTQRQAAQQATNGARFSLLRRRSSSTVATAATGRWRRRLRVTSDRAGRGDAGARGRRFRRQRRPGAARPSASPRTGPSPSRATSARSRQARTRARPCITISSSATTSRCASGPRAAARRRRCASSRRRRAMAHIRASSTWWSSTPRAAGRCKR